MIRFVVIALVVCIAACQVREEERAFVPFPELVGRWVVEDVYANTSRVTDQLDPWKDTWLEFTRNGMYSRKNGPWGRSSGRWIMDHQKGELFLDSDDGREQDSYWTVSIEGGRMTLKRARLEMGNFELICVRQ